MSDDAVVQDAGMAYLMTLSAVSAAITELIPNLDADTAGRFAPLFVAALARRGHLIQPMDGQ